MVDEQTEPKTAARKTRTATASKAPNIFELITLISREAGALEKTKEAGSGVPFPFRGIDGTINHLAPFLTKYGVVMVPEVLEEEITGREVGGNKFITQTRVKTKFTFYAPDGSHVSAVTTGLAQDYADRSTAQAQSVALRVALLQTFFLPTQTIEPEAMGEQVQAEIAKTPAAPTAPAETIDSLRTEISELIAGKGETDIGEYANARMEAITGRPAETWAIADFKKFRDELKTKGLVKE